MLAQKITNRKTEIKPKEGEAKLRAAQACAERGWYIFPVHVPIFDAEGQCIGCSCEHYKRSEEWHETLKRQGEESEFNPKFKCDSPGKCPAVRWREKSTNDLAQVGKWWGHQWKTVNVETGEEFRFWPNIGLDTGKSHILALDDDKYKRVHGDLADWLSPDETDTVSQLSGSHEGSHILWSMNGEGYSNKTGDLPPGIDIRGVGGYIVLTPSLHKSGNCYEWINDPAETELKPVPAPLKEVLDKAKAATRPAQFSDVTTEKPDLSQWKLSYTTMERIKNPAPDRDRSEEDYSAILALIYAGATPDDILAVFQHYPIGTEGKFAERGLDYLALSIGNAQTYAAKHLPATSRMQRVRADQYCEQSQKNKPLAPDTEVIWLHGNEQERRVRIVAFDDWRDVFNLRLRFYVIKESAEPVCELELFVEQASIPKSEQWLNTLRSLDHTFKLNQLEDVVEMDGQRLDDIDRSRLYLSLNDGGVTKAFVDDCINVLAAEQKYHPVRDYLNGLQWDGKNHLKRMIEHLTSDSPQVTYADGAQAQLHAALIYRWLLGCVARGLEGDQETAFKHQTPLLALIGPQNIGKSSWLRWLCSGVGIEYHREGMLNPHLLDHERSAVNKWIWEVSELGASLRKDNRDALKSFLTQEWHTYRKPWGRGNITKPTLCCFAGSLNPETGFLDDPTGHRRFLPVSITAINHAYKDVIDVNQLWAQLVHLYKSGESPELAPCEKEALQPVYAENEVENPLQTYLQMYFEIEPGNKEKRIFTADIMTRLQQFGVAIANNAKVAGRELNDALAPLKLERKYLSIDGAKGWGWVGIEANAKRPPSRDIIVNVET